jgi:proteasome lid subunit RPN8/RPN11
VNRLVLSAALKKQIEDEGVRAFPNECCGIMLGRDVGDKRIVDVLEPVENAFEEGEKYHRFSITPQRLMQADREAGKAGKLVLGFYHSHPDHPAKPSEYDRVHGWPFYSYVIVSIMKRVPADMTCWVLDEATEQFAEQPIVAE